MQPLAWIGTLAAGIVAGAIGMFLVLPLGLIAHEYLIYPMALGLSALFASIAASWISNLLASDGTRSQLLRVVGLTEGAAVLLGAIVLLVSAFRESLLGPVATIGIVSCLILGAVATVAAGRSRTAGGMSVAGGSGDLRLSVLLVAAGIVLVTWIIFIASLFGLTGA